MERGTRNERRESQDRETNDQRVLEGRARGNMAVQPSVHLNI